MKNLILVLGLLISSFSLAQNEENKQILVDTYSFVNHFEQRNYDKIMDLTYPKIIEVVGKENFITAMKTLVEGNEEFQTKIHQPDFQSFEVSDIFKTQKGEKYAFVSFPMEWK